MKIHINRLTAVALMIFATAFGMQSCSDDEPEYVKVTGITVTPDNAMLMAGDTITLVANVFPRLASDKNVIWKSDNLSVATVDDNGVVTAIAEGVANISVTSVGNSEKTKTCVVTVVRSFSISLNVNSLSIPVEATNTLVATIVPDNVSQEVKWTSDNTGVATVQDGVVTAISPGTATITAALVVDETVAAECIVTVVELSSPSDKWLVGMWTFEDVDNPVKATVGADLDANGNFTVIDGPGTTKAVQLGSDSYFTINHNIGANGNGEYTNEYTLMMDIRGSQAGFSNWLSVFNNSYDNEGEGVLWIDGEGMIGFAPLGGYSSTGLTADTWHRVVIAANLAKQSFKIYIDGKHVFTASNNNDLDSDVVSLYTDVVYIGYDGAGYAGPDFAEVRMWSVQLTDDEINALGKAQ
jgi:hypothetical protein